MAVLASFTSVATKAAGGTRSYRGILSKPGRMVLLSVTAIAVIVVAAELAVISYVRFRYMDTPFLSAAFQIVVGGALVFFAGILIGNS